MGCYNKKPKSFSFSTGNRDGIEETLVSYGKCNLEKVPSRIIHDKCLLPVPRYPLHNPLGFIVQMLNEH